MTTRTDILNLLAKKINAKTYLEIGVRNPEDNFNKIVCEIKHGVDPALNQASYTQGTGHQASSDVYFQHINKDTTYDLIFIDGLHTEEQVDKDILNSLSRLNDGGFIVLHDCSPPSLRFEQPDRCGTVWRSIYKLRRDTTDLHIQVVDTDFGCGVVCKGTAKPMYLPEHNINTLTYNFLDENRSEVLNLVSVVDFVQQLTSN